MMHAVLLARGIRVAVPLALAAMALPALGQTQDHAAPIAVETQANPRGPGPEAPIPPDPATADSRVAPAMPADPGYHAGPYTGALTPPPATAMGKAYPLCTATLRDACINPDQARAHRGR